MNMFDIKVISSWQVLSSWILWLKGEGSQVEFRSFLLQEIRVIQIDCFIIVLDLTMCELIFNIKILCPKFRFSCEHFPKMYELLYLTGLKVHNMTTEEWPINLSNWAIRSDFTVCNFISFVIWWHYFQGTILLILIPWY